jgi:SRSO17 transposase
MRAVIPECRGMLILDSTSFLKQGRRSVAVRRQYCGTLGIRTVRAGAIRAVDWCPSL